MNDEELLRFDTSRLAHYETGDGERRLQGEHADIYRNHLRIAQHLDGWVERSHTDFPGLAEPEDRQAGFEHAMAEIAAHLRQGDYLPGGVLYEGL